MQTFSARQLEEQKAREMYDELISNIPDELLLAGVCRREQARHLRTEVESGWREAKEKFEKALL
jgi:hypothetical protein